MPALLPFLPLFLGGRDFFFGLQPIVQFRAGLISPFNVELVSSHADALFERNQIRACFWFHGNHLRFHNPGDTGHQPCATSV